MNKKIKLTREEQEAYAIITGLMDEWSDDDIDPELTEWALEVWRYMHMIFSRKLDKINTKEG